MSLNEALWIVTAGLLAWAIVLLILPHVPV
jgi:hypothetical protein